MLRRTLWTLDFLGQWNGEGSLAQTCMLLRWFVVLLCLIDFYIVFTLSRYWFHLSKAGVSSIAKLRSHWVLHSFGSVTSSIPIRLLGIRMCTALGSSTSYLCMCRKLKLLKIGFSNVTCINISRQINIWDVRLESVHVVNVWRSHRWMQHNFILKVNETGFNLGVY